MTKEQLDAIRARVEAATPGPWVIGVWSTHTKDIESLAGSVPICACHADPKYGLTYTANAANADLISNAPTDLRALLAEVDRLQKTIDAVGEVISQNGEDCDCDCTTYGAPHGPDCDPCLVCRVDDALGEKR